MTSRPRYYFKRDRESGRQQIVDRDLHKGMVIATADFRESAMLIVIALNEYFKSKESENAHKPDSTGDRVERDEPQSRTAVLGDLYPQLDPKWYPDWGWRKFPGDDVCSSELRTLLAAWR